MSAAHTLLLAGVIAWTLFAAGVRVGRNAERADQLAHRRMYERIGARR